MAETTVKYVTCPACHRLVTVTPKGRLRRHQQWVGAGVGPGRRGVQFPPICKAVGQTLAEARASEVTP